MLLYENFGKYGFNVREKLKAGTYSAHQGLDHWFTAGSLMAERFRVFYYIENLDVTAKLHRSIEGAVVPRWGMRPMNQFSGRVNLSAKAIDVLKAFADQKPPKRDVLPMGLLRARGRRVVPFT